MENKATFEWDDWDYDTIHRVTCKHCDWMEEYHSPYWEADTGAKKLYTVHWEETHGADK